MKNWNIYLTAVFCAGVFLTGCSSEPAAYEYTPEKMEALVSQAPEASRQAEPFAGSLCVVMGDEPLPDPSVGAASVGVFSVSDGQVLVQKNLFERRNPASTTKIMTALLAIREADLSELVTVGDEVLVESGSSLAHINPGDTLTMEQLLYGLMLASGNDAAAAIAVHMSGSIEAFADRMNQMAWEIGATDTHFTNPHGLTDENHYTTAYDLYLMYNEAMKYQEFRKIAGTVRYTASYTDGEGKPKVQEWKNSNQYLTGEASEPEGVTAVGGKTGTTSAAGSCLVLNCQDENHQDYVAVVLKAENRPALYENMTNIIGEIVN